MTDEERMKIAINYMATIRHDAQLLSDYNEMIVNVTVLMINSTGNINAIKVCAESLFLLGYNAGAKHEDKST